jgi:hypothetical protein
MDEFDTVLRLEHQIYEEGKSTGEKDAKAKAYKEGYDFGVHQGGNMNQEIGFISGFLQFYAITTENFTTNKYTENIYKTMKQLMRLISDFDMDAGNEDMNGKYEQIRSKFKLLQMRLSIPVDHKNDIKHLDLEF